MRVIRHINGMFDVYSGEGWDNHTRIQVDHAFRTNGILWHVDGIRLTAEQVTAIRNNIVLSQHYQTIEA